MMKTCNSTKAQRFTTGVPDPKVNIAIVCQPGNDLFRTLKTSNLKGLVRYDDPSEAVAVAPDGGAVIILAQAYPDCATSVAPDVLPLAEEKGLRIYVEYPSELPGMDIGQPMQDDCLRGVVVSDFFGDELTPMRIVLLNGCRYIPVKTDAAHMALAKVVGVDTAVFGLENTETTPLLFEYPTGNMLVAATKFSNFIAARHMPAMAWKIIWESILKWLLPSGSELPVLKWQTSVRPRFGQGVPLPEDAEENAVHQSADWIFKSRILRHPDWPAEALGRALEKKTIFEKPGEVFPVGDGSIGVLEGYTSAINADGSQRMSHSVRADCCSEIAMLLSFDATLDPDRTREKAVAFKLVNYAFEKAGFATGPRSDPESPCYGLLGMKLNTPGMYWADDNARAVLSALAVSALGGEQCCSGAVTRCVLSNLRLTGPKGHRRSYIKEPDLLTKGWRYYRDEPYEENTAHMEAWILACFMWAYTKTGCEPFLERSRAGLKTLMEAYPDRWEWVNGSGALELARALLPLSWMVRVDDTPEHRGWLERIAEDLIDLQDPCGAIREIIRVGNGAYKNCMPKSNADFGTCETSLIASDGDLISDLLYTCNFALIGLHEAASQVNDPAITQAENRLAEFLCRIQVRSEEHPELDGAWYRAFNYGNWEYWASNSDFDWGPWCTETGWTQPWIVAGLALRKMNTCMWDLLKQVDVSRDFDSLKSRMGLNG